MKKTLILIFVLILTFDAPSSAFFNVEYAKTEEFTDSKNPVEKRKKKQKRRVKRKKRQHHKIKNIKKTQEKRSKASVVMIILSLIFTMIGLIMLFTAPAYTLLLIIMLVLLLLGLIFMIISFSMNKWGQQIPGTSDRAEKRERKEKGPEPTPAPAPVTKQDVVYLKNGSIIRGNILEQIIGETIKIETRDGSVFVYKMEEVTKITKEEIKK